jgi:hypothetical protein
MIPDYIILCSDSSWELAERVCRLLKDGWYPQGGVSVTCYTQKVDGYDQEEVRFAQAMICEVKPTEDSATP